MLSLIRDSLRGYICPELRYWPVSWPWTWAHTRHRITIESVPDDVKHAHDRLWIRMAMWCGQFCLCWRHNLSDTQSRKTAHFGYVFFSIHSSSQDILLGLFPAAPCLLGHLCAMELMTILSRLASNTLSIASTMAIPIYLEAISARTKLRVCQCDEWNWRQF